MQPELGVEAAGGGFGFKRGFLLPKAKGKVAGGARATEGIAGEVRAGGMEGRAGESGPSISYSKRHGEGGIKKTTVGNNAAIRSEIPYSHMAKKPEYGESLSKQIYKNNLPTNGEINYHLPKGEHNLKGAFRKEHNGYEDKFGNIWKEGRATHSDLKEGKLKEWDVQLCASFQKIYGKQHLNVSYDGKITHGMKK